MATEIKKLLVAIAANATAADAQTLENGRLVFDGERLRVHDDTTAGGKKVLMLGEGGTAPGFSTGSVSAAGTDTLTLGNVACMHCHYLSVAAGSGAFTREVVLPLTVSGNAVVAGSRVTVVSMFAATVVGYFVDVFSGANSNPKISRVGSQPGAASAAEQTFFFNGTAWVAGVPKFAQ